MLYVIGYGVLKLYTKLMYNKLLFSLFMNFYCFNTYRVRLKTKHIRHIQTSFVVFFDVRNPFPKFVKPLSKHPV